MSKRLPYLLSIIILVIVSLKAIWPLTLTGFFPMHDDTQVARVFVISKALSAGQFPVRWVSDLGYGMGYPLFNFYAPLPYYLGAFIHLLGFDFISSVKIMAAVGMLLSAVTMFILIHELTGSLMAAFTLGILYMYTPYHAVNLYVRGAVGELYAYALLPLVIWGVYIIYFQSRLRKGFIILSLALGILLITHNILGFLSLFFLVTFCALLLLRQPYCRIFTGKLKIFILSILLAFGLSSFFILPALFEKNYTRVNNLTNGGSYYINHFVYPDQLWDSPWGFGGSADGRADGLSFKLGKVNIVLTLIVLVFFAYALRRKSVSSLVSRFYLLLFVYILVSLFFMLDISRALWGILPFFPYIQFPWRFINFELVFICAFSSLLFIIIPKKLHYLPGLLLLIFTLVYNSKYFTPLTNLNYTDSNYLNLEYLQYNTSKISDEYLSMQFAELKDKVAWRNFLHSDDNIAEAGKEIINLPQKKSYSLNLESPRRLKVNIAYFPGWYGYLDDKIIPVENDQGRILVSVPAGKHIVRFELQDTPIRVLGNTLSFISAFLLVYISLFSSGFKVWQINKK